MPDSPQKWEVVSCSEGATLLERESGQLMHSKIGAWAEANTVYVAQSELNRRGSAGDVVIYDVGMGIAANSLAVIAAVARESGGASAGRLPSLKIFSFERHPEALELALASGLKSPGSFPFHIPYREALGALLKEGHWETRTSERMVEWKLISGDFREAGLADLPPADLVYFDFYAPSVCPELWGVDVFSKLRPKMAEQGRLITYSTAKSVRAALLLAGFFVGEGASTPMKNATTLASPSRKGLGNLLDRDWLASLDRSTKPLPDGWKGLSEHPQFAGFF